MFAVSDNMVVTLDYTLRLDDGEVVDTSEGGSPLEFVQGTGSIISGLERQLAGLVLGEQRLIVVPPSEGYGEFDENLLEELPRSAFPADMVLEQGMGFRMRTDTGHFVDAFVDHLEGDKVVVDMNHPLAGEILHFDVRVAGLREATAEELEASRNHSPCCGDGCGGCHGEDSADKECEHAERDCQSSCCQSN